MSDTFEDVKGIIVELLGIDESKVKKESRFREDLEADSLDLVESAARFLMRMHRRSRLSARQWITSTPS